MKAEGQKSSELISFVLEFNCTKKQKGDSFAMKSITQDLKFKQAAITYSFKYGVTKAAIQYKKTRQWIYYWRKRYIPGDIHSLQEKSRKPHSHPNAHKDTEILLIENMRRRNPDEGLTMF